MIRVLAAIAAATALAGCASVPVPPPQVSISGPTFARSQFDCGQRPLPPDPGQATGKSAALHENKLGSWGEGCQSKLQSVGSVLESSGQVVKP